MIITIFSWYYECCTGDLPWNTMNVTPSKYNSFENILYTHKLCIFERHGWQGFRNSFDPFWLTPAFMWIRLKPFKNCLKWSKIIKYDQIWSNMIQLLCDDVIQKNVFLMWNFIKTMQISDFWWFSSVHQFMLVVSCSPKRHKNYLKII